MQFESSLKAASIKHNACLAVDKTASITSEMHKQRAEDENGKRSCHFTFSSWKVCEL